ncbi:recombination-associated protein RdgC [Vibrio breoganii]
MTIFFNACRFYKLNREMDVDFEKLEEQLSEFAFSHCTGTTMQKTGWVSYVPKACGLADLREGNLIYLRAATEKRLLPAKVVNREVRRLVEEKEAELSRRLKKTERDEIKEDVLAELVPRAFTDITYVDFFFDIENGLLGFNCASAAKCESTIALLRKTMGSLPCVPFMIEDCDVSPNVFMTKLALGEVSVPGWLVMGDAKVQSYLGDEAAQIVLKKEDMSSDTILALLGENGRAVTSLGVNIEDRIVCSIDEEFTFKSVKFCDDLKSQNEDIPKEDLYGLYKADMLLNHYELTSALNTYLEALKDAQ